MRNFSKFQANNEDERLARKSYCSTYITKKDFEYIVTGSFIQKFLTKE